MTGALRSPTTSGIIDLTQASPQDRTSTADVIDVSSSTESDDMARRLAFLSAFDEHEFTSEIDALIDDPDLRRDS